MVLEKEYGEKRLRKFLSIEMDNYLNARSNESEKEKPLLRVDPGQGYILYQKGGIIFYGLSKYIGEDSLNHAIQRFLKDYSFKAPPYPTTLDLLRSIRQSTPDSMQYFVTDGFEKIVFYNNGITNAKLSGNQLSFINGRTSHCDPCSIRSNTSCPARFSKQGPSRELGTVWTSSAPRAMAKRNAISRRRFPRDLAGDFRALRHHRHADPARRIEVLEHGFAGSLRHAHGRAAAAFSQRAEAVIVRPDPGGYSCSDHPCPRKS